MKTDELSKFTEIMVGLAENFSSTLSKPGLKMRFKALISYSIGEVESAAISIINDRKYLKMPTHAEFIEHIKGGSVDDFGSIEAGKVLKAVRQVGGYKSVVFDDATTQAVIMQGYGGWIKLCEEMTTEQEKWLEKDFRRMYKSYTVGKIKHYGILSGITATFNSANGLPGVESPTLIGDEGKAANVAIRGTQNKQIVHKNIKLLPGSGVNFDIMDKNNG